MRFVAVLAIIVLGMSWSAAHAQTMEDMQRCRSIADESRRLACYDAIVLAPAPRSKYDVTDLADLKSFALSYRDQLVKVTGWIRPSADLLFLGVDAADTRAIPIDFGSLTRRDRQAFLDACGKGCQATVQGRVRPVNFTTGIIADTLVAH